jgi:hypothetical protein
VNRGGQVEGVAGCVLRTAITRNHALSMSTGPKKCHRMMQDDSADDSARPACCARACTARREAAKGLRFLGSEGADVRTSIQKEGAGDQGGGGQGA